jgi:hypothetical protein
VLGISAERVRQLAARGALPSRRTPLGRLYNRAAVEALAARRRKQPTTPETPGAGSP